MAPPILLTMVTTIFTVVFLVAALIALGAYIHYRKDIRTLNVSTKPFDKSPKQKYARLHDVASIENIEQALMKGRTNVDSGLILGVNSVKQYDNDLIQSKEIDLPTGAGTI